MIITHQDSQLRDGRPSVYFIALLSSAKAVLMNPPFGRHKKGADIAFLEAAVDFVGKLIKL
jgi:predicted RNA methylase